MKNLAYKLYAASFNLFAHFPLRRKKAALLSPHMAGFGDSLGVMEREMQKRGYRTARICGSDIKPGKWTPAAVLRALRFYTCGAYRLATAGVVYLNDNFMPMADLHIRSDAVWVQLWHAEGAFKRFGLDVPALDPSVEERVRRGNAKLSYVICSSRGVAPVYAGAFGVPQARVLPLGSPRAEQYMKKSRSTDVQAFRKTYFGGTDKKVVLYAPTFRDDPQENRLLLTHFDFDRFQRVLGDRYQLVLRLHPQFHDVPTPPDVCNMTGFTDASSLIAACDLLVTDYSSICMDFALLGKPSVFYAFDLAKYADDRSFYFEYEKYVPGIVAEDFDALLDAIVAADTDRDALNRFVAFNFDDPDGRAAERIADLAQGC